MYMSSVSAETRFLIANTASLAFGHFCVPRMLIQFCAKSYEVYSLKQFPQGFAIADRNHAS